MSCRAFVTSKRPSPIVIAGLMAVALIHGMAPSAWAQGGAGTAPTSSAATPAQAPLTVQDWVKRSNMFGDWGGTRTRLEDRGFKFDASWTQFFQSTPLQPPFGDRRDWDYGGKLDFKATQDFTKQGWSGVSVTSHVELRYGDTTLLAGGTFLPTNSALLFPEQKDTAIRVSSLYISKMFGTNAILQAGRFNTVDNYVKPFTGGEGLDKFQNLGFVVPPLLARTTPPVTEGVFFTTLKNLEPFVTVGLFESTDAGFFDNGATVLGSVSLPLKPFVTPGHYVITGTVSSVEATALDQSPWVFVPDYPGTVETEKNAWTLDFTFDQYIWWDPAAKTGWGVFGMIGWSDGNPSMLDTFGHIGIGGTSPIPNRSQDNFGVGYAYSGVSNTFRDSFTNIRLRNENTLEVFYNVAVTGWSKVAANMQFVDPFAVGSKTRTFFSVRWKLIF